MKTDEETASLEASYARAFLWPDVTRQVFCDDTTRSGAEFGSYRDASGATFRYHYRRSYEVAVETLYQEACRSHRRDPFVLPLMFLWRHLIEVTLKDLIREFRELFFEELSATEAKALRDHKLPDLWQIASSHVRLLGCGSGEISNLDAIFEEIHHVDPYADGFRYPFRRDGETKNLEGLPGTIDIEALNDSLRGALNFLSAGFDEIQRRDDFFSDYEVEMAREHGRPSPEDLGRARRAYFDQHDGER